MDRFSSQPRRGIPRWIVIALIPLAFAMGYVSSDDERIAALEELERVERQQAQLKQQIEQLRELGYAIERQCKGRYASLI